MPFVPSRLRFTFVGLHVGPCHADKPGGTTFFGGDKDRYALKVPIFGVPLLKLDLLLRPGSKELR